jgi:Leucine-rich repeat (LRR) protein
MSKAITFIPVFIAFLHIFVLINVCGYGAIPEDEREALIALYNATNGDKWQDNSGWKEGDLEFDDFGPKGSEATWKGITVSENHVTKIVFDSNNLTGSLPPELGNFSKLKVLRIVSSELEGKIPPELGNLQDLKEFHLLCLQIGGSIPPELGKLSNLEIFRLGCNHISIPVGEGDPFKLGAALKSYSSPLSGSIPPELGKLTKLKELNIRNTQLSGPIPSQLGKLTRLQKFLLENNFLGGSIPFELGKLNNLKELVLRSNQLEGNIPPGLGNLSNLEKLNLGGNKLSGSIPRELGNLINLKDIVLSGNDLEGSIPPEIGNLHNLEYLHLNSNRLSGNIPPELGNLTRLQQLHLNSNQLIGNIPINLSSLTSYLIKIDYNSLYLEDKILRRFLNRVSSHWADTQTTAPVNVSAAALTSTSIKVSWTPITYKGDKGGYMIYYRTTPRYPWTLAGITPNKTARSYEVKGLNPGTKYYFVLQTRTDPHVNNKNIVVSELSKDAFATTLRTQGELRF